MTILKNKFLFFKIDKIKKYIQLEKKFFDLLNNIVFFQNILNSFLRSGLKNNYINM